MRGAKRGKQSKLNEATQLRRQAVHQPPSFHLQLSTDPLSSNELSLFSDRLDARACNVVKFDGTLLLLLPASLGDLLLACLV